MHRRSAFIAMFLVQLCIVFPGLCTIASAAEKDADQKMTKVAGILVEKQENKWITVKADGEDEPVKYPIGATAEKKVNEAMKMIFNASRVQLTYTADGDNRKLVSIQKQATKAKGTVTGEVVKVYDNFWIELKTKNAPNDAYAPGPANWQDKAFMEKLKGLKQGDSVTIKFHTDFERHRIETMTKN